MAAQLYKIGDLARMSGVTAKTIRFYSDSGLLPPTATTEAGYRLYDDAARGRLETIRALREIGLDLPTIRDLLRDKVSATAALSVQLAALEQTLRTVQRQRALLKAALDRGEEAALAYLDRARALARFDALERQHFLGAQLERVFEGVAADEDWKARFWRGAVLDFPEELSAEQFAAWLELAELLSDETFLARLNAIGRASWNNRRPSAGELSNPATIGQIYAEIAEAQRAGRTPRDPLGQQLLDRYLALQAGALGRTPADPALIGDILAWLDRHTEPRAARYWELIGIIKGWSPSPVAAAHEWLVAGLHERAAAQDQAGAMSGSNRETIG